MANVGARSAQLLSTVQEELRNVVTQAMEAAPPWLDFSIVSGARTAEEQNQLYQKGRSIPGDIVTKRDGYTLKSRHQFGDAIDIAAWIGGQISWDENAVAARAGFIIGFAAARGLRLQGGVKWSWDFGHIEIVRD